MSELPSSRLAGVNFSVVSLVLALGLGVASGAAASTTLDTGASGSTACCNFQTNGTTAGDYGQAFVVPVNGDDILQSYTFQIEGFNAGSFSFDSSIYAWNATTHSLSGSALFTSNVQSSPSGNSTQTYTFSTGGLTLTGGGSYIAVLQPASGSGAAELVASAFNSGVGNLYFGSFTLSSASAPSTWGAASRDAAFTATFTSAATAAPEPAAWALMILGLGGLGAALRQRQWATPQRAG